jgi:hypothetical protein
MARNNLGGRIIVIIVRLRLIVPLSVLALILSGDASILQGVIYDILSSTLLYERP